MNINVDSEAQDPQNEDKSELEKKLEEVESLLSGLTDTETEDTWNEEEMIKSKRVVQFVLNSGQTILGPEYSVEDSVQNSNHSLSRNCHKKCLLKTQTGFYINTLQS